MSTPNDRTVTPGVSGVVKSYSALQNHLNSKLIENPITHIGINLLTLIENPIIHIYNRPN